MIRTARGSDAQAIAEVHVASWRAAYAGLMPDARLAALTVEERTEVWKRHLEGQGPRTIVVEHGGRIVAFGTFGPSRDEPAAGEVWALYAHPDAWGTGAGRALLADGLAFLSDRTEVMLWVLDGNARAIRFYQAAGFHLDGGRADKDGLAHLRMRLRFPSRLV